MKNNIINNVCQFISRLLKKAKMENIDEYSSQCSYYTILSFITALIVHLLCNREEHENNLCDLLEDLLSNNNNNNTNNTSVNNML